MVRKRVLIGEKCRDPLSVVTFSRVWQQPSMTSSMKLYSRVVMFNRLACSMKDGSIVEAFGGWALC